MAEKDFEFSKRLEKLIKDAGLNNRKVADAVGISAAAMSGYINEGRIPEAPILLNISRLLKVSMEELLTGEREVERGKRTDVHAIAEPVAMYAVKDAQMNEIIEILKEHPGDKKLVLKLLKGKKDIKEALEGFGVKGLVEEG